MPLIYSEGKKNAMARLRHEIARHGTEVKLGSSRTPFNLKGVPKVNKFINRLPEISKVEQTLLPQRQNRRQKVFMLYVLGGIGKTQLAVELARRHHQKFTSVLWLEGRT